VADPVNPDKLEKLLVLEFELFEDLHLLLLSVAASCDEGDDALVVETLLGELLWGVDLIEGVVEEAVLVDLQHLFNGNFS
jgi:hypothetical protein